MAIYGLQAETRSYNRFYLALERLVHTVASSSIQYNHTKYVINISLYYKIYITWLLTLMRIKLQNSSSSSAACFLPKADDDDAGLLSGCFPRDDEDSKISSFRKNIFVNSTHYLNWCLSHPPCILISNSFWSFPVKKIQKHSFKIFLDLYLKLKTPNNH